VVTFTRPEVIDVRQRVTVAKVTTVARGLASLDQAAYSLNTRPRQTLGDMTPSEKLAQVLQ